MPLWVLEAGAPSYLPYAVAASQRVTAVIFSYPLKAGHPTDPANKILWVVHQPGTASVLQIDGHAINAITPSFHQTEPAASFRNIYPSIVDVSTSGCWHLDLSWSGYRDVVELPYQ